MRYRKCWWIKVKETEKTKRRHGKGGGYGDDLDGGIAAQRRQPVATHRTINGGIGDMHIARRPAPNSGGASVDRARGCQFSRVALNRYIAGVGGSCNIARRVVDAG